MAKADLGVLNTNLRGKVDNSVYLATRGGVTIRKWLRPANPRSEAQESIRCTQTALAKHRDGTKSWRPRQDSQHRHRTGKPTLPVLGAPVTRAPSARNGGTAFVRAAVF